MLIYEWLQSGPYGNVCIILGEIVSKRQEHAFYSIHSSDRRFKRVSVSNDKRRLIQRLYDKFGMQIDRIIAHAKVVENVKLTHNEVLSVLKK